MIEYAIKRLSTIPFTLYGKVNFCIGDIMCLADEDNTYDKVISTRVLINLGSWDNQIKGLNECVRVLKPGGVLLLSEATLQGWRKMNKFRQEWGLSEIPMPPFNFYSDGKFLQHLLHRHENFETSFSSNCFRH